jgi:hypothetical protein
MFSLGQKGPEVNFVCGVCLYVGARVCLCGTWKPRGDAALVRVNESN